MPEFDMKVLEEKLTAQKDKLVESVETLIEKGSTEANEAAEVLKEQITALEDQHNTMKEEMKKYEKVLIPGLKDELEKKDFNFAAFIRAAAKQKKGHENAWGDAEYEKEILDIHAKNMSQIYNKDMRAGDGTEGGYLIPDEVSSDLVGLTIANMAVQKMGTTTLTGLIGELPIPRQTARNTGYWVGETETPTESSITFDLFTLRPKKAAAYTRFSNRLLYQTRGLINTLVRESIADALALTIDLGFLNGTGSDSQPKGLLRQTGMTTTPNQSTTAARFRIDKAASMIQAIDVANELIDGGNFGFIMRPEVQGGMRRERVPQFTGQPIGQGSPIGGFSDTILSNEQLAAKIGYKMETTTQLSGSNTQGNSTSSSQVIFGNFKQMYTGFWRGMEIKVSDVASVGGVDAFTRDLIHVVAFQEVDCNFGRLTAFTIVSDAETDESLWTNG